LETATTRHASAGEAVSGSVVPPSDFGRKIVKTADLGITSENVRGGAAETQQVAAQYGGTIVSSQTYRANNAVYADLILSVPSERFEDALDELRGLGEEVTTDTVSRQDVTEEYVVSQSRERNLLAAEQSLLVLYNRADDVQDALSIQRELTGIRGQIEQVQGRGCSTSNRAATRPRSPSASRSSPALRNRHQPGTRHSSLPRRGRPRSPSCKPSAARFSRRLCSGGGSSRQWSWRRGGSGAG